MSHPYDLVTALSGAVGQPGDTFWLRGGIHVIGHVETKIEGAPGRPITFRQWPGEKARVDGTVTFWDSNGYVILRDFELFSSNTNRLSAQTSVGFNPTDISIIPGISTYVPNMSFINLVVHDQTRHGFYLSELSSNSLIYGCVVYNNGWWAPDNAEGHGLYVQAHEGDRELSDNLVFNNSGVGFHIYESHPPNQDRLDGVVMDGNLAFNSGAIQNVRVYRDWIVGVDAPASGADRIVLRNNMGYDTPPSSGRNQVQIGRDGTNGSVQVLNNYFPQGLEMNNWTTATVVGNLITTSSSNQVVELIQTHLPLTATWNSNTYVLPGTDNEFRYNSNAFSFPSWQGETGFDLSSASSVGMLSGTKVFIRTNRYEAGRANIIVYNWDGHSNVSVDVSSVLNPGALYEVRNAEDFFAAPVLSGTYTGGALELPMTGLSVATPSGPMLTAPPTGPTFNVFVLLPGAFRLEAKATEGGIQLSWPTNAVNWVLQFKPTLSSDTLWVDVTNAPVVVDREKVVLVSTVGTAGFYRLRPSMIWLQIVEVSDEEMTLSWPANAGSWILQYTASLSDGGAWTDMTNTPVLVDLDYEVVLSKTGDAGFYRLRPAIQ